MQSSVSCSICYGLSYSNNHADYSATLFQDSLGFDQHTSSLMAGCLQTWFLIASVNFVFRTTSTPLDYLRVFETQYGSVRS